MVSVVVNEFGPLIEWYWYVKSEMLDGISFLVPLSTMNPTWAGSGSKPRPFKHKGQQHNPCMAMELSLRKRLWKWDLKLHTSRLNIVALALNIGLYYQRIWLPCHWNKCTNLVKCISHALIFQSKSCNVGPETAHFSCNNAFCMSTCRTARHSIIISWWSVSSSGTLAIIWKYSYKNQNAGTADRRTWIESIMFLWFMKANTGIPHFCWVD